MKVTVKPFLFLRNLLGFQAEDIALPVESENRVEELLSVLRKKYKLPDCLDIPQGHLVLFDGSRPVGLVILINGRNIDQLQGLKTVLQEGDSVALFPPAAGG